MKRGRLSVPGRLIGGQAAASAWPRSRALLATLVAVACSSGPGGPELEPDPGEGGTGAPLVESLSPAPGLGDRPSLPSAEGPVSRVDACVQRAAAVEVTREPVDIILLLDNSGSMADELEAVERSINTDFADVLAASGVDYRVILVSRHRSLARPAAEEVTFVCVESPLSALADCQSPAGTEPAFSQRFFHYSLRLGSKDSLTVALDTFEPPFLLGRDQFAKSPGGWSAWLREGARPVFVELTDDDSELPAEGFVEGLSALSAERFGTLEAPRFIFHSIVGVGPKEDPVEAYQPGEPVVESECGGGPGGVRVKNAGPTYQALSRMSGGLRFPLCEFEDFDVVFRAIAQNVVESRAIACTFPIPDAPARRSLDLESLSISASIGENADLVGFEQVATPADCRSDAFVVNGETIDLCPAACTALRQEAAASVSVLFGCQSEALR